MQNLERPDGSVVTPIGWVLIAVGLIGVFVGALAETLNGVLIGFGLANLGIGLGVVLLSLGYLVRSIWFLPGREIEPQSGDSARAQQKTYGPCDWCGRELPAGFRPCTSFDSETLVEVSMKVRDPTCKSQLQQRGFKVAPAADPDRTEKLD